MIIMLLQVGLHRRQSDTEMKATVEMSFKAAVDMPNPHFLMAFSFDATNIEVRLEDHFLLLLTVAIATAMLLFITVFWLRVNHRRR